MTVLFNSNHFNLWSQIVQEAEASCSSNLNVELETYLITLLVRYTDKPEIIKEIMATSFMEGVNLGPAERAVALQKVGDTCLIYSGFFPGQAEKRLVKLSYFVALGRSAYGTISRRKNDLYDLLKKYFVAIMDILQSVRDYTRGYPDLTPIQAYDLWNETGSQRALQTLRSYSRKASPQATAVRESGSCIIKLKR